MNTQSSIAIVGAGLFGRLLAWRLARLNHRVTLFERGTPELPNSPAYIAAGMVAPWCESIEATTEVIRLGHISLNLWPKWLDELARDSGEPRVHTTQGTYVVAHPLDLADWQHFVNQVQSHHFLQHAQVGGILNTETLTQDAPELAHFNQALYLPDEIAIDNRSLLHSLMRALQRMQVIWHSDTLLTITEVLNLSTRFDHVFDCRGLGAKDALPTLRGVRGEVLRIHCPQVQLTRVVRLIHPRYQLYIAPRANHEFVIGATSIESESMNGISVRSSMELMSALVTVSPHFFEATVLEAKSHCRPALPDHNPLCEQNIKHPKLWHINGLYRHGFMLSPAWIAHVLTHFFLRKSYEIID
ncbi:MAG: thiO [Burkholderiaceae bacterium]|nr:thiO [Burkholderiaceae bacterium]